MTRAVVCTMALLVALGLMLGALGALLPASSAQAAGAPTAEPSAAPDPAPDRESAPTPPAGPTPTPTQPGAPTGPTFDAVGSRGVNTFVVGGSASPGSSLRVLDPEVPSRSLCETATASAAAATVRWSCTVTVSNGAGISLTVRDTTHPALPDASSASFSVLGAPTVRGGLLLGAKASGTGEPGAVVTVSSSSGASASGTADASGEWSAVLDSTSFPSGRYTLTATQRSSAIPDVDRSGSSAPVQATVDRTGPTAPVITAPASGDVVTRQPVVVEGTGEDGATVTVYIDGSPICQATVADGSWRCDSAGSSLPSGAREITAAQVDAAGNFGPVSAPSTIRIGPGGATSAPTASPSAPTAPGSAVPSPSAPEPGASPSPDAPTDAPTIPAPTVPGSDGGAGTAGGAGGSDATGGGPGGAGGVTGDAAAPRTGTWATATSFGRDLPRLTQTLGGPTWPLAVALGLLFLAIAAGPVRLAVAAAGARLRRRPPRLTGRNRALEPPTSFSGGSIDPRLALAVSVAVGSVAIAFSAGVDDQVQYARLLIAIVIGVVALNGLAIVLPAVLLARRLGSSFSMRLSPALVVAALVAVAVTRVLSLDPPLVLGVLVTATLAARAADTAPDDESAPSDAARGVVAVAQLGALVVVSLSAWALLGVVGDAGTGFPAQLTREVLVTLCLAGLGSLVVSMLPLGSSPGQALWSWSPVGYGGVVLIGATVAALVFVGGPGPAGAGTTAIGATLAALLLAGASALWARRGDRPRHAQAYRPRG